MSAALLQSRERTRARAYAVARVESPFAKLLMCVPAAAPRPRTHPHAHLTRAPSSPPPSGGAVSIGVELCGGHFLEFMKISKQTSTESYAAIFRRVTAAKGLAGTLDGFLPWGLFQAVAKGGVFSAGQAGSLNFLAARGVDKDTRMVISGGCGGLLQGVAMSPLLLLKTRVMTDASFRASGSVLATAAASLAVGGRIVATEGPRALLKGVTLFSLKRAADWTTRYLFVVMVENWLRAAPDARLSAAQEAAASLLGGALSAVSTIPMDVMVASKQSAGAAGKPVTFADKIAEHGVGGMLAFSTRGLLARIAHVSITTLAMKMGTTVVYDVLLPAGQ